MVVGAGRIRYVREELIFNVDGNGGCDLCAQARDGRGARIGFDVGNFAGIDRGGDTQGVEDCTCDATQYAVEAKGVVKIGLANATAKIRFKANGKIATEGVAADGKAGYKRAVAQPGRNLGLERNILKVEPQGETYGKIDVGANIVQPTSAANGKVFRSARDGLKDGGGDASDGVGVLGDDVPGGSKTSGLGGGHISHFQGVNEIGV